MRRAAVSPRKVKVSVVVDVSGKELVRSKCAGSCRQPMAWRGTEAQRSIVNA